MVNGAIAHHGIGNDSAPRQRSEAQVPYGLEEKVDVVIQWCGAPCIQQDVYFWDPIHTRPR
jgi:hypothetical protein